MESLAAETEKTRGQWDIESNTLDTERERLLAKFGTPDLYINPSTTSQ